MSMYDGINILGKATAVDLNALGDTAITVPTGSRKYHFEAILTNASATLSGGALEWGLYSAPARASASDILAFGVNSSTSLTAADKVIKIVGTDSASTGTVYFNVETANGSAVTCDVYIVGYPLP